MSIIKRISTSFMASIDELVGEIENHDALIKAAIDEQKKKIATAKVQLGKIRGNEKKTRDEIAELSIKEKQWGQRALKMADDDESQALQCMQRREIVQQQIKKLETMQQEYAVTASKIAKDIERCESDLKQMVQKHELMRARQSSVSAMNVINEVGDANLDELQTSFDRWEIKLAQGEYRLESFQEGDLLEEQFIAEEQAMDLKAQLEQLKKES